MKSGRVGLKGPCALFSALTIDSKLSNGTNMWSGNFDLQLMKTGIRKALFHISDLPEATPFQTEIKSEVP